ncbi:flavin reductase family protein [Nocardioides houyundeii]|uniref:flavin reductase family protein n=1 Tax=Nocardioides houyundeii TaxID=2045452 RepID=UPI000DF20E9E|nr:flavin reductase family protein [Nocardioides houyundeii]
MTIHTTHPFASEEPDRDPARRLRGRLGGVVTLWTAGDAQGRAGLTVSSVMVAGGEPGRVLGLLDPDSDLAEVLQRTRAAVVHLLRWEHRDLADAFAGVAPAPGGPFRTGVFVADTHGPRLESATTWARVEIESLVEVGWSLLVTATITAAEIGDEDDPLMHRRGRYRRVGGPGGPAAD